MHNEQLRQEVAVAKWPLAPNEKEKQGCHERAFVCWGRPCQIPLAGLMNQLCWAILERLCWAFSLEVILWCNTGKGDLITLTVCVRWAHIKVLGVWGNAETFQLEWRFRTIKADAGICIHSETLAQITLMVYLATIGLDCRRGTW